MAKVYIAGPMQGFPNSNFESFFAAEKRLVNEGWQVFNPAKHDIDTGMVTATPRAGAGLLPETSYTVNATINIRELLLWDLARIAEVDFVYLLPNWTNSKGVAVELAFAKAIDVPVIEEATFWNVLKFAPTKIKYI